jgi:hypothetical protein
MKIEHPEKFKYGTRILILMLRGKDGGKQQPDHTAKKRISTGPKDFDKYFAELSAIRKPTERIYCSLEQRSISKAIRLFKQRQLDNDYNPQEIKEEFYLDIFNRWVGCLANPKCNAETLFLVDIDNDEDDEAAIYWEIHDKGLVILHEYATKNGRHIVLAPFNPSTVNFKCDKNSLMLLEY